MHLLADVTSDGRHMTQAVPDYGIDEELEAFSNPLVLAKFTQVGSGTDDDSGLVKVIIVQANLRSCNRAEWFVPKDGSSSPSSTVPNSVEEEEAREEVPEAPKAQVPQVQLYREEEEEEEEDLVPEPYPAKRRAEKAAAKRALNKEFKETEVSHM